MSQRTPPSPDAAAGSGAGVGRRAFLGSAAALAALTSSTAFTTAPQVQPGSKPIPAPATPPEAFPGGADPSASRDLARKLLLVGEDGSDLKLEYLNVLIDGKLPPAPPGTAKKVLVIGAGVAGLTAATLLKAAGHQVVVIEANGNRVGGRIKTFRGIFADKALHAEAGAMRLPDFHPLVLALADKLGVQRHLFYNADITPGAQPTGSTPPVTYRAFTGQTWTNGKDDGTFKAPPAANRTQILVNSRQTSRGAYATAPAGINATFAATTATTMSQALDQALRKVTVPTTGTITAQLDGWTKVLHQYDGYSTHRYLVEEAGWSPAQVQAAGTLENLTSRLHYSLVPTLMDRAIISPTNRYWQLQGGTASLTDALAAPLRDDIKLGRRMTRLVHSQTGVRVETTAESGTEESCDGSPTAPTQVFEGDYAIVTIPFSALRFCTVEPPMSYPKRRAVTELHYDSATKVLLEFKTRFWEQGPDGFTGGGCVSDSPSRFTYFPSQSPPGSTGGVVLAAYTWSDDAMRWDSLTEGERYAFALNDMERMFGPVVRREYTGVGATQSWARARYALGEAVIFTPGQLHELHPASRTVEGRIHFAGEHTSLKAAWIEGALESAVRTVLEVHHR